MELTRADLSLGRQSGLLSGLRARGHLLALGAVLLLAGFLRFYNLSALGEGNLYYTAGVASMLQSWSNFFFVAAEPGGSVTIDKPPLGFWLQTIAAFFLGLNGFAVMLPQIIAGLLSIVLLYHLVGRQFGRWPGVLAALALAITPVAIAADRNNTIDSLLVLALLLAAWAFIRATETGKLRHLLLGALIVGLGFNIKMLQAYLALPAFFALYLLGARVGWWRKIWQLAVAGIVVLAVSFSWALAVDLTPPSQRPYVGSSTDNTVTELIIGHNGLSRLLGRGRTSISLGNSSQQQPGGSGGDADQATRPQGPDGANDGTQMTPPQMTGGTDGSNSQASRRPQPPSGAGQRPSGSGPGGQPPDGGGGMGGNEIGQAGWLRLVSSPLSNEVSWLLPFGLLGAALLAVGSRLRLPVEPRHQALVLWGGWLGTELVFFSMASFFHAYYLTMLAAPLAALVGMAATELWRMRERRPRIAIGLLLLAATGTLAAQYAMAGSYVSDRWWAPIAVAALAIGALLLFIAQRHQLAPLARAGFGLAVAATLVTPLVWSTLTTTDPSPNARLPHAYAGSSGRGGGGQSRNGDQVDTSLISFLEANTQDVEYLVAVPSANEGDVYVLATGRPVLYMGGFSGSDSVVSADDLAQMVDSGKLRYVLWGGDQRGNSDLSNWIASHATIVAGFDQVGGRGTTLYELR